jgi:hypothetical protein
MGRRILPDRDLVRQLLDYDPATGVLTWRPRKHDRAWSARFAGRQAGHVTRKKYRRIKIGDAIYLAHRLAWLHAKGEPVPHELDHIDRDKMNNRISNLRAATQSQNRANIPAHKSNKLGVKGVFLDEHGRYLAVLVINGRRKFRKRFKTVDEAAEAYREAALLHYGEFARTGPA